jgi:fatty acid desaturase
LSHTIELEAAELDRSRSNGPDAALLAQRMAALKIWARDKGYYDISLREQTLRILELFLFPAVAFFLLSQGGAYAFAGLIVLAIYFPRTAYLGHDVAHNQWGPRGDSKPRLMLWLVALAQGFGSTWWVDKHELHHSFPNGCRVAEDGTLVPIDGDIDSPPWVVWDKALAKYNEKSRNTFLGGALSAVLPRLQVPLFFPLLALARFNWSWQSIGVAFREKKSVEASLCALHWISGFAIAGLVTPGPAWTGWLWFLTATLLGGFILAAVFVLNHTGMEVYDAAAARGFYDRQARSTRNTPSSGFWDWLTGGLNSQIEHHMFPTMARRNLRKMREVTKRAMVECGYAYEELTNREAMWAVLTTLTEASRA